MGTIEAARKRDERLVAIARDQYGVINMRQLLAIGFTPRVVGEYVRRCRLERIVPTVYRIAGVPSSWEQGLMVAHLWAREPSAISGACAGALIGLAGLPRVGAEVAVFEPERRSNGLPFKVRRLSNHLASEITEIERIPVLSPRLTVLDLAGMKHPRTARALDDCLFKEFATLGQFWLLYDREWTKGRRGIAILRELLVQRTPGRAPTQTDLEDLFVGIVDEFHLPEPERQYPIDLFGRRIRLDFAYPDARLGIECDSHDWHLDTAAFERDRERDNLLSLLGWEIRRFTSSKLRFARAEVADVVRSRLAARLPQ